MKKFIIFNYLVTIFFPFYLVAEYDLTILGFVKFADGIGRHPIGWIDCLKDECKINFISTRKDKINFAGISPQITKIINDPDKTLGKISIFVDMLTQKNDVIADIPLNSKINFAFSMLESSAIPQKWVEILNNKFDAVIVPDENLVAVYSNSGVKIPIFALPWGAYLEDFLARPIKKRKNVPFKFGMSAAFYPRKNQELLIDAFAKEFGNNKKFSLHIHGRGGPEDYSYKIRTKIRTMRFSNIYFVQKEFNSVQYIQFMSSLDCYVFPSRGEGFSITPREALALGIPCILSNNTAHKTICASGFVRPLAVSGVSPAYYEPLNCFAGYEFNTSMKELQQAMRQVYNNYDEYLFKARTGREWVKQYLFSNLKKRYKTIVKPKKVILGDKNIIEENFLMTNSEQLFSKYQ